MSKSLPPYSVDISPQHSDWPKGVLIAIESPVNNSVTEALSVEFTGFIVALANSDLPRAVRLRFIVAGTELLTTSIDLPRPDLEFVAVDGTLEVGPNYFHCGFNTVLPSFLSQQDSAIQVRVEHEARLGERALTYNLATIEFRPFREETAKRLKCSSFGVVSVNSIGRSGSSLICRALNTHPAFFTPTLQSQFGEVSIIGYYLRTIAVLASEGAISELNRLEVMSDFLSLPIGYTKTDKLQRDNELEFHSRLMYASRTSAIDLFCRIYDEIHCYLEDIKPSAQYWVEKNWNLKSTNIGQLIVEKWREVIVVRAFKGFFLSQLSYRRKLLLSPESLEAHIRATYDKYVLLAESQRDRHAQTLLVRYEDLIAKPVVEFERIFSFLDASLDDNTRARVQEIFSDDDTHHVMLASPLPDDESNAQYEVYMNSLGKRERQYLDSVTEDLGYTN